MATSSNPDVKTALCTRPVSEEAQAFVPHYSHWRHGGWYVHNVQYPSGAVGCVSNNYPDRKWRIVCDKRELRDGVEIDRFFKSRDDAARAEFDLAKSEPEKPGSDDAPAPGQGA